MTSDRREVTQTLKRARQTERDLRALSAPTTIGDRRSMRRRDRPAAEGGVGRKAFREATACTTAVTVQIAARGTARGGQRRAAVALVGFSTTPVLCARFVVGPLRWQGGSCAFLFGFSFFFSFLVIVTPALRRRRARQRVEGHAGCRSQWSILVGQRFQNDHRIVSWFC